MVFCRMKIAIVSVFPPYRGGIAQFNEAMAKAFTAAGHECIGFNFSRQYPSLLFLEPINTRTASSPNSCAQPRLIPSTP